jgi:hypothetical protein
VAEELVGDPVIEPFAAGLQAVGLPGTRRAAARQVHAEPQDRPDVQPEAKRHQLLQPAQRPASRARVRLRRVHIQHRQPAAGGYQGLDVAQRGMQVRHVMEGEHAQHEIVLTGTVTTDLPQVGLAVGHIRAGPSRPCHLDHRARQVNRVNVAEARGQQHRVTPGSAAEVKRPAAGRRHAVAGGGRNEGLQPPGEVRFAIEVTEAVVGFGYPVKRLCFPVSCQYLCPGLGGMSHD